MIINNIITTPADIFEIRTGENAECGRNNISIRKGWVAKRQLISGGNRLHYVTILDLDLLSEVAETSWL